MPIVCPDCKKTLDEVTIYFVTPARVQEDGTIMIPDMLLPARIKYEIEKLGAEIIICPECDAAVFQFAADELKLIPVREAKVQFIAEKLARGRKESKTLRTLLSELNSDHLDFYASFYGFDG